MTKVQLIAYLSNVQMLDTDVVMIKTADGTEHAIASIERFNGAEITYPAGASDIAPLIVIQLA